MCPYVPMLSLYRKRQLKRRLRNKVHKDSRKDVESFIYSLLDNLEEVQLESLFLALDSRGGDCSRCISFPPSFVGDDPVSWVLAMCKAYRWEELKVPTKLRKMPYCHHHLCLNPYHYANSNGMLFTSIDICNEDLSLKDLAMSETEDCLHSPTMSIGDDVTNPSPSQMMPYPMETRSRSEGWCSLAYWEGRKRVGRLFPVQDDYVNVFDFLPKGEGFCLAALPSSNEKSLRTKKTIGHGLTIATDQSRRVWLFNRSERAIFVQSPLFEPVTSRSQAVHKLFSGHCVIIYDFDIVLKMKSHTGPCEPSSSVKLSFTKGWGGPNYRRPCITACPCWLEILFNAKELSFS